MAPTPQENQISEHMKDLYLKDKKVVISGVSGLYPGCKSVKELADILYSKKNPLTSENNRWDYTHPELPQNVGLLPDLNRFDAQFFKVNYRLGNVMDVQSRKILEQAYQAIYDAGVNPEDLSGKKVGVYVGICFSETEKSCFYVTNSKLGLGIPGCSKSMFANRISYWLNAKGPSMAVDEACCSSIAALEQAYQAIRRGECDSAIVGSGSLCLMPQTLVHQGRITKISMDGVTKSFDQQANGCARTEAVNVLFLQKAEDALRIYGEVAHVKAEYISLLRGETGSKFGFNRNPEDMAKFLNRFYKDAGVPPAAVEYVEAFGCADPEADKSELESIDNVFCTSRPEILPIGSVMSNIGYSEAASGFTSITKVILACETGVMAGNLHYSTPRDDISGIREERIRIVQDNMPFSPKYTAINGLSVTGVNSHTLLKTHYKVKNLNRYKSSVPRLVTISGRQDSAVKSILNDLKSRPIDAEELALLHNIHKTNTSGHMARGFAILDEKDEGTVCLKESVEYFDHAKRPLWFVYSGMGSQWPTMGTQLMRIPIFAASIERCQRALVPKGVDIVSIITSPDRNIFDNILHSFVGIAAIQIGLTDILKAIGITPDKIIGHSVGELGCAYADGCLTAEEMILSAYSRGLVSVQTPFIRGSMAAVGLGYNEVSKICPPSIDVACHNSSESSTISGPAADMKRFVAELVSMGIFAKEVACSNIAYHSRYIAEAEQGLLKYLKETIKVPKKRSERWVSTSVPESRWNDPIAKYSSAEYHTNNLLNPVLFEETARLIPHNAVLVEIAPHGLLQAILKRSLHPNCHNLALTRRGHPDNTMLLLEAIGKLYIEGFTPRLQELYPKVEFPVSTGTPMLSHLVEWMHTENWQVPVYKSAQKITAASCKFIVSLYDEETKYLSGNIIRGKVNYPFAAALVAVWDTYSMWLQTPRKESVIFRDIKLYSQPILHEQRQLKLNVALHRGTGKFEVTDDCSKVATGYISKAKAIRKFNAPNTRSDDNILNLNSFDIYQLLQLRDWSYSGDFRSICQGNSKLDTFSMIWDENWVTLIDGLLQINALRQKHDGVSQPTDIQELSIDVIDHIKQITKVDDQRVLKAKVFEEYETTQCGGVFLKGIKFHQLPHITEEKISLEFSAKCDDISINYDCLAPLQSHTELHSENKLEISTIGDLKSLQWVKCSTPVNFGIEVTVHYAGLSKIDVAKAIGDNENLTQLDTYENYFGLDFSGVTQSGMRVMGIAVDGSCKTTVSARSDLLWPIPDHWTLEEAATVPLAYMTALYCLNYCVEDVTHWQEDQSDSKSKSILIHGGAGALGQAFISIALALGYEIYTTTTNCSKKRFLTKLFPKLKEKNIGNSRDSTFEDMVRCATNQNGCNIVINCLKGTLRNISLKCSSGVTLDVSNYNLKEDRSFGLCNLTKARSYIPVNIMHLLMKQNTKEVDMLQKLLSKGISEGYVRPLSRVTYAPHEVSRAFQLVATSQHRGRVLLKLDQNQLAAQTRIQCKPDSCYVVFCGQNNLGVQLVDKLISRGANKLCLHFNSPPGYLVCKVQDWKKLGAEVKILSHKIDNCESILKVLNSAATFGSIDGIVFDASSLAESNSEETQYILRSLDLTSRKFDSVRYFAVMSDDCSIASDVCLTRQKCGYSGTSIDVSHLKKGVNNLSSTINRICVEAIETALCSEEYSVLVTAEVSQKSLIQKIFSVVGLQVPENCEETTTLRELGLTTDAMPILSNYLQDYCNITLVDDIASLTLNRIKEIEDMITAPGYGKKQGLETFYSFVDPDELLATTEILFMPTLASSATIRDDEFDVGETSLCIIPGLEGHHGRFRGMCERLKLPAFVLQPGLDNLNETIQQTAQRYANILQRKLGIKNHFYILGYETGVFVSLELAAILEQRGLTGTVFLLGGSCQDISSAIESQLRTFNSDDELQDAVIRHMYGIMSGDDSKDIEPILSSYSDWDERVEAVVRTLLGGVSHSAQYARAQIEAAFARLVEARRYSGPAAALRSRVVLLRCPLSARSDHTPQHDILAPLSHAAMDLRCAAIINTYLDEDIIHEFEKKNLCETYLLNSDTYMSFSETLTT